jgi:hypothetical protein
LGGRLLLQQGWRERQVSATYASQAKAKVTEQLLTSLPKRAFTNFNDVSHSSPISPILTQDNGDFIDRTKLS